MVLIYLYVESIRSLLKSGHLGNIDATSFTEYCKTTF